MLSYGSKKVVSKLPSQNICSLIFSVLGEGMKGNYQAVFHVMHILICIQEKWKGLRGQHGNVQLFLFQSYVYAG